LQKKPLQAGAEAYMPMQFYVDPQLPEEITFFTLQYTLYDVTARASDLTTKPNPFMESSAQSGE